MAVYLSLIDKSISMFSSKWLDEKVDCVSFSDVYKPVALSFNCCASSSVSYNWIFKVRYFRWGLIRIVILDCFPNQRLIKLLPESLVSYLNQSSLQMKAFQCLLPVTMLKFRQFPWICNICIDYIIKSLMAFLEWEALYSLQPRSINFTF